MPSPNGGLDTAGGGRVLHTTDGQMWFLAKMCCAFGIIHSTHLWNHPLYVVISSCLMSACLAYGFGFQIITCLMIPLSFSGLLWIAETGTRPAVMGFVASIVGQQTKTFPDALLYIFVLSTAGLLFGTKSPWEVFAFWVQLGVTWLQATYFADVLERLRGPDTDGAAEEEDDDDPAAGRRIRYAVFVLGSGGHTKEMLDMIEHSFLGGRGQPQRIPACRRYIVGADDSRSLAKARALERKLRHAAAAAAAAAGPRRGQQQADAGFDAQLVRRARDVGQPWRSVPLSALRSACDVVRAIHMKRQGWPRRHPDVLLTNGPATGGIALLVARLLRALGMLGRPGGGGEGIVGGSTRLVYIENWSSTKHMSLTGRYVYHFKLADLFIVQHVELAAQYPDAHLEPDFVHAGF